MTTTAKGRSRQQALFDFLGAYPVATTDQLTALIWGGNERLARSHLLRYVRSGRLRRLPHPLYRNGAYVYTRSERATTHAQKVLHHLAEVDFHLALVRNAGRYGARIVPELPWGPGLVPDQTVFWRETVWAVEHHLTGQFAHADDYRRFMEDEAYTLCHWWRTGIELGLLVVTATAGMDRVMGAMRQSGPPSMAWRVGSRESVLRDPGVWLRPKGRHVGERGDSGRAYGPVGYPGGAVGGQKHEAWESRGLGAPDVARPCLGHPPQASRTIAHAIGGEGISEITRATVIWKGPAAERLHQVAVATARRRENDWPDPSRQATSPSK